MPGPFTCPHCGAHDYVITLTGCEVSGGTLQEGFQWDESAGGYESTGSVLVESESIENEGAEAICAKCERDVSDAVAEYEESLPSGEEAAEA